MTPDVLRDIGKEVFGEIWLRPLAELLNINVRTLQRMLAGDRDIPPGVATELRDYLDDKVRRLRILSVKVSAKAA